MKRAPRGTSSGRTLRRRAPDREAVAKVRRAIQRVARDLPERALTPEASLVADLGIDSLKFAELSLALEEEFGRPIFLADVLADVDAPDELTVGGLAERLRG